MNPLVSIIVPVYNAERYLKECLDSILMQTLKDIEIICVDDGSADNSQMILQDYRRSNKNITVISQRNQGAGAARNVAIDRALGEYVAFMDADDYYPENDVLEKLYKYAKEENVSICGGSLLFEQEGRKIKKENGLKEEYCFGRNRLVEYKEYQFAFGYTRFIYRAMLLKKYQIRFPEYRGFEDPPFMVKAMICAKSFYAIAKEVYVYRGTDKIVPYEEFGVINGIAKGLDDTLEMSLEENFETLHGDIAICIFDKYIYSFYKSVYKGNREMQGLLERLERHINEKLLKRDGRIKEKPQILSTGEIAIYMRNFQRREEQLLEEIRRFPNVVIYGAGKMGKRLCDFIERNGYAGSVEFGVSYQYPKGTACGKKVRNIREFLPIGSDTLVLIAVKGDDALGMTEYAKDIGFENVERIEFEEVQLLS